MKKQTKIIYKYSTEEIIAYYIEDNPLIPRIGDCIRFNEATEPRTLIVGSVYFYPEQDDAEDLKTVDIICNVLDEKRK